MILFQSPNPLDDIATIIRNANPETASGINGNNIAIDNVKAIDPETNDGYNTECEVRMVGIDTAVGLMRIRFNRLTLSEIMPEVTGNKVRVEIPTKLNKYMAYVDFADRMSKAFGTMLKADGIYRDFTNTNSVAVSKGNTANAAIAINPESLRYTPETFSFDVFGLGIALSIVVTTPGCVPFRDNNGFPKYEHAYWDDIGYVDAEAKRSAIMTVGSLDFTSVWGTDPTNVIIPGDTANGELAWKFTDEAFEKINLILSTNGLPPLPENQFASWGRGGTGAYQTPNWTETNYHVYIKYTYLNFDYKEVANLHPENGTHRDHLILPYRTI